MNTALELTIGHLYFVKPGPPEFRWPPGLRAEAHVQLIYHKDHWCLVKTWQGKVFSVPEDCLSID